MGIITYDQDTSHLYNEDGDFIGKIYREGDGLGPLIEERVNGWLELSSERDKLREQVKILREALENCVMELRQYHAHYNAKCEGGCPALVYIEEAESAIAKAKGA